MKSLLNILLLFILSVPLISWVIDPVKTAKDTPETQYFPATQSEGWIGHSLGNPLDSPLDNIFEVVVTAPISETDKIWLTYELYGISDHNGISKSINDQHAVGGSFVQFTDHWTTQEERVKANWLHTGKNIIRFTLPEGVRYHYKIRKLGIRIQKPEQNTGRSFIINTQRKGVYFEDKAYLSGFISGKNSESAVLLIDGKEINTYEAAFEHIVSKKAIDKQWSATFQAKFTDGEVIEKTIHFVRKIKADHINTIDQPIKIDTKKEVIEESKIRFSIKGASITMDQEMLSGSAPQILPLRAIDIPALNSGLVNVTGYHAGYRMVDKNISFDNGATVALAYDPDKIPKGYKPEDIRTYYFNTDKNRWQIIAQGSLDAKEHYIISKIRKKQDMINGILKTPESPESNAYTPTSIKDIKAADPSAAINLMLPPSASHMGDANMAYAINVPSGRQGMQPQLALQYSSGGSNSWLGLGWNLQVPSISIDTRWGVPRYDATLESETYLLNGEQLSPIAHKGELKPRSSGDKQFYRRVEGVFDKIIRHGNTPADYYWEVTDKMGTRYFYGGIVNVDNSAVLKDDSGNIAYWCLVRIEDLNGNFVTYKHSIQGDTGLQGGTVMGQQLYCEEITYTGHGGEEGKYRVLFTRDREMGESLRVDKTIDARYGFKKVTADLLRKIEVQFNGKNIRSYELKYTTGAFFKTLLETIIEYNADGGKFTQHDLEYFDDVRTGETSYVPFESNTDWSIPTDDNNALDAGFTLQLDGFSDDPTLLSGNASKDISVGGVVAVGFDANVTSKSRSIGGSYNNNNSDSEGNVSLIDINGDGLQDKVFRKGNKLFYRPNKGISVSGTGEFDPSEIYPITGISEFYTGESNSNTFGLEATFGIFVGFSKTNTESSTTTYFTDANGDQLVDIVRNGIVYFNTYNPDTKEIVFTPNSEQTLSPVFDGEEVSDIVIDLEAQEADQQVAIDQNPLHDVVRMWRAPYSGRVSVGGAVQRIVDLSDEDRQKEPVDSIRVAVQLRGTELWSQFIDADDTTPYTPSGVTDLSVQKGDDLYFRAGSVDNGSFDQVNWIPEISYIDRQEEDKDANGISLNRFSASEDFLLTAPFEITPPLNGTVAMKGNFVKPQTTDDIKVVILRTTQTFSQNGTSTSVTDTLVQRKYAWYEQINTSIDTTFSVVNTGTIIENYAFKVLSSTNVDWAALDWKPRLEYTSTDRDIDLQQSPIVIQTIPDFSLYAFVNTPTQPYPITIPGDNTSVTTINLKINPQLTFAGGSIFDPTETDTITFSVKKRDTLLAKKQLTYIRGNLVTTDPSLSIQAVTNKDTLFIEYHTRDKKLFKSIVNSEAVVSRNSNPLDDQRIAVGLYTSLPDNDNNENIIFGHLYRGWGQFGWNGNREKANLPIKEDELKLSEAAMSQGQINTDGLSGEDLDNMNTYDPAQDQFILMVVNGQDHHWMGYDKETYLDGEVMSSSRYGRDNLDILEINTGDGTGLSAIDQVSKVNTTSFTVGGGIGPIGGSASRSDSKIVVSTDYMDMNGDRYPDIVTNKAIQYTNARGGLSSRILVDPGNVSVSDSGTNSVALSGSVAIPSSKSNGSPKGTNNSSVDAGDARTTNGGGVNIGVAFGDNDTGTSYMDINGDGLPDRVNESNKTVQLNLGYRFAAPEPWNFSVINTGDSTSETGGFGFSLVNGSISGGLSLARSDNEVNQSFQDINGDGLIDIVIKGSPVKVRINDGNSFSAPIDWQGINKFSKNETASESKNFAITFGFYIPLINLKFIFNPSAATNRSMSRETSKITDIDGDGFPDYLTSESERQLSVKRSTIARTNKLKSVKRPLGASFALDYTPVGNTFEQPNIVWALSQVELFDGFEGDGADTMLRTFEYQDGFYDRNEREFFGFKTIKTNQLNTESGNSLYRTVVQKFNNENYYEKGLLEIEALQDDQENLFTETINSYSLKDVETGDSLPDSIKQRDDAAAFPAMTTMVNNFYEGQSFAGETTTMSYGYDRFGSVNAYTDEGDTESDDDLFSNISYHIEDNASKYLVGIPKNITARGNGRTLRDRQSDIDSRGNIIEIRKKLEDGGQAIYNMEYNNLGNLIKVIRPQNQAGERMFYDYQYDPEVQIYVENVSDAYGYTSTSKYDYGFGQLLKTTDINGFEMRYSLDNVGRVTKIVGPLEIAAGQEFTLKFDYNPDADIPWALTQHYDPQHPSNQLETVTFIDGLARLLQVQKDGQIFQGVGSSDQEVRIATGRLLFDAFGRTISSRFPTTSGAGAGNFVETPDTVIPSKTEFDVLDRTTKVTLPDGSVTTTVYGFGNDRNSNQQFSTLITDANGIQKERFTNIRGLTTSVREQYSQGGDIWTSYAYNAINELIEVSDEQNNRIFSTYDNLGRRTSVEHPDAGLTSYVYDSTSNLTKKITANLRKVGQAITYTYDRERLTNITYPQNSSNNVKYTYGNSGDSDNRAGRIHIQEDATGRQEFSYNALGARVKNRRDIIIANKKLGSFTTQWEYDTWNRITSIIYPDKEEITYTYNLGGLVESLSGVSRLGRYQYVDRLGYDKFEDRVYMACGNGTESFYSYEQDRRRLKTLITESATNRRLMDNVYTYDKEINILKLLNKMEVSTSDELLGGPSQYNYSYDDLYRLTNATGLYTDEEDNHRFSLDMAYNSIHNITKKTQVHESKDQDDGDDKWIEEPETTYDWDYQYGDMQPHAPIKMGKFTYQYDLNGNLISRPERTFNEDPDKERENLIWDEENRLTAVTEAADDEAIIYNIYDASGERTLKTNNDNNVEITINGTSATPKPVDKLDDYITYVNPYYVLRKDYFTTHFYIGNERVATKLSEEDKDLGLYFYHSDHIGSSAYTTGISTGETTQHIEYFPFGETFIEEFEDGSDDDAGKNNPYRFNAKELDEETGLYYYGARYYDPRTSIWTSVDPLYSVYITGAHNMGVFNSRNLNSYMYCYQNPIILIDPNGMQTKARILGGLRAVGGILQAGGGVVLLLTPEPTMLTKVGGVVAVGSGVDDMQAGFRQLWTGQETNSAKHIATRETARALGASDETANTIATGVDIGISFVGSGASAYKIFNVMSKGGSKFTVAASKFDYFFGRVVTGKAHNIERSAQNLKDLTTLGIKNESQLMRIFAKAMDEGVEISTKSNNFGTTVTKSVEVGGKGRIDVSFFYEAGNMASKPKVTTIIPKIFN